MEQLMANESTADKSREQRINTLRMMTVANEFASVIAKSAADSTTGARSAPRRPTRGRLNTTNPARVWGGAQRREPGVYPSAGI